MSRSTIVNLMWAIGGILPPAVLVWAFVALPHGVINSSDNPLFRNILLSGAAAGLLLTIWACGILSKGKGLSAWYALGGLLWVFGPLFVSRLKDRPKGDGPDGPSLEQTILPPAPVPLMPSPDAPLPRVSSAYQGVTADFLMRALVVEARVCHVGLRGVGEGVNATFAFQLYNVNRRVQLNVPTRLAGGLKEGSIVQLLVAPGVIARCLYDPEALQGPPLSKALSPDGAFPVIPLKMPPPKPDAHEPPEAAAASMELDPNEAIELEYVLTKADFEAVSYVIPPLLLRNVRAAQAGGGPNAR